jgi:hypothetical protein
MKISLWVSHIACVAIGVTSALLYDGMTSTNKTVDDVTSAARPSTAAVERWKVDAHETVVAELSQGQPPPEKSSSPLIDGASELITNTQRQDTEYAAAFLPGVYGSESAPQLASTLLPAASRAHADHLLEASDRWSVQMESLLQSFFLNRADPPAVARISISCRVSQCKIQVSAVKGSSEVARPPMEVMNQLKQQEWYSENFGRMSQIGTTTASGTTYAIWTLQRRE